MTDPAVTQLGVIAGEDSRVAVGHRAPGTDARDGLNHYPHPDLLPVDGAAVRIRSLANSGMEVFVGLTVPGGRVWTLWADVDGPQAAERLERFSPAPALLVQTSTPDHVHAYWPLATPVTPQQAWYANLRIAVHLGADRATAHPSVFLCAVGTLRNGHRVTVRHASEHRFADTDAIVGELAHLDNVPPVDAARPALGGITPRP